MPRAPVFRPHQRVPVVLTSTSRIETAVSAEVASDANVSSPNEPVVVQEASTRRSTEGVAQPTGVNPDTGAPPSTLVYFGAATSSQPGARREAEPDGRDPSCADNEADEYVLPPSGSSGHGSFLDWASDGYSCFSDYSAVPGGQLALLDDVPFLSNLHHGDSTSGSAGSSTTDKDESISPVGNQLADGGGAAMHHDGSSISFADNVGWGRDDVTLEHEDASILDNPHPSESRAASSDGSERASDDGSPYASEDDIWLSTDEYEAFEPVGLAPVSTVEDYCAFLFLSGQANITEAAYNIFRMFFNAERANGAGRLRCITTIRRKVAPAMREAWGLPLQIGGIPATDATGDPKSVYFILPSTHVKRDVSFRGTYDLFFAALGPDADGTLEPEYYHSMMHLKRKMVTFPLQQPHFNFDGNTWTVGGLVNILLTGGTYLEGLVIGKPEYASAEAGLHADSNVRAGDFVVPCYADGLLVGRIVSPHWLTNFAARISWCPVADRSSVVEALEPAPYDGPRVEPTSGAAETLPMGGITGMDAKGNKWLRLAICPFTDDCTVRQGNSTSTGTVAFAYPGWRYRDKASRHAVR